MLHGLSRFNAAHPWSHNDAYIPWVSRQARLVRRSGGTSALDVGCGTGNLLRALADVMETVTGIEPDAETAARARATVAGIRSAVVREGTFDELALDGSGQMDPENDGEADPRPGRTEPGYDLVTFVAVLHHLPLAPTLEKARSLVRPGGRLVIVGLAKETAADLRWSVASLVLNPVMGALRQPRRVQAAPQSMTAPTAEPRETLEEIADVARAVIPGVTIRRALFWRYTAVWVAPTPALPGIRSKHADS
ncbi:methyltransferase [Planctomonas sp. JC2975]|nr:methyltransferase [Planctomonas sp. JC2975]NNC12193.1 methyltransferase [Planctomonas sp. JC2975]